MAGDQRRGDAAVVGAAGGIVQLPIRIPLALTLILRRRRKLRSPTRATRSIGVGFGYYRWSNPWKCSSEHLYDFR